jgi:hypothetical protein
MVASYERLADSAFEAAMNIQRLAQGGASSFEQYREFVKLLEEPLAPNESYKLLYDARNLPLYRAAWSNVFGQPATEVKTEVFLKRFSEFLRGTLQSLEQGKPFKVEEMSKFCLALNQIFLQENARQYATNYRTRMRNAPP